MKKDIFLNEVSLAIEQSNVRKYWYEVFQKFIDLTLKEKDIDMKFYGYLVNFNNILMDLANTFPMFFECGNSEKLNDYLDKIEKKTKIKHPVDFLWKSLCDYLHTFKESNSDYNIEINEISEMIDILLYLLEDDLNID